MKKGYYRNCIILFFIAILLISFAMYINNNDTFEEYVHDKRGIELKIADRFGDDATDFLYHDNKIVIRTNMDGDVSKSNRECYKYISGENPEPMERKVNIFIDRLERESGMDGITMEFQYVDDSYRELAAYEFK